MSKATNPNLESLRKSAKQLLSELESGNSIASARYIKVHGQNPPFAPKLTGAQHVLAIEAGYSSWPDMIGKLRSEHFQDILLACEHLKAGRMVVLLDDESRENEGDLCIAAELAEAQDINFMAKNGRGTICLSLADSLADNIGLRRSIPHEDLQSAPFTQSIDALEGITTGVSAFDRCKTIRDAVAPGASLKSLKTPGHVFPLRARKNGVLERRGHTEGSVDLATIAGCKPAAVVCEIMKDDGSMAKREDCVALANSWNLPTVEISRIVEYRRNFG